MSPRPKTKTDEAILTATLAVVMRIGPTRLTLADVAREAGVSPATLVQRFGSKRGLLLALAAMGSTSVAEQFAAIRRIAQRSPLRAIYAYAECMADMAVSPEALSNNLAFLQIDLVDPDFHRHALAHSDAVRAEIRTMLDRAIAAGELARCDTAGLARAVQALVGGSLLQWAIDRNGRVRSRLREDLDALLAPRRGRPQGRHHLGDRRRRPRYKVRRD